MRLQINQFTEVLPLVEKYDDDTKRRIHQEVYGGEAITIAWFSGYCCPNCGAEIYGLWLTGTTKAYIAALRHRDYKEAFPGLAREDADTFLHLKACPVCGKQLSSSIEDGYFVTPTAYVLGDTALLRNNPKVPKTVDEFANSEHLLISDDLSWLSKGISDYFAKAEKQRERKRLPNARKQISEKVALWDVPAASKGYLPAAAGVKQSTDSLKSYILQLLNLETSIYALKERLTTLYCEHWSVADRIKTEKGELLSPISLKIEELQRSKPVPKENTVERLPEPEQPQKPTFKEAGFFNKKKIEAENAQVRAEYDAQCAEYEEKKRQHKLSLRAWEEEKVRLQKEAEEEKKAAVKYAMAKMKEAANFLYTNSTNHIPLEEMLKSVDEEIGEAEKLLQSYYKTRNELYSYDIIYGKYRDPVALASFYEYLMAGRCESLEGANGAYNLYESEVRAKMIISQLSTIISQLEDIKDNQYTIYTELKGMRKSLNELSSTMKQAAEAIEGIERNTAKIADYTEEIANNSSVIAYNTAKTAFYAKKNAELTNALGYMMALK